MQRRRIETESITHKYCNSSTKPKFYKNTRLIDKIIEKTSLANFYSKGFKSTKTISFKSGGTDSIQTCKGEESLTLWAKICATALPCL